MSCKQCGSHAINHYCHGRDGSDGDLCDVCYWRKRAEAVPPAEKPWYPDDSGDWVEVPPESMSAPKEISGNALIYCLLEIERNLSQAFIECVGTKSVMHWDVDADDESRIVAYKLAKRPSKKAK